MPHPRQQSHDVIAYLAAISLQIFGLLEQLIDPSKQHTCSPAIDDPVIEGYDQVSLGNRDKGLNLLTPSRTCHTGRQSQNQSLIG